MTETQSLGARANAMIDALAAISADPDRLTRLYLSPEHRRAADLVAQWMEGVGMDVTIDGMGTVRGRYGAHGGSQRNSRTLLVGSHIDSVVDAGRFDGTLGVIAGILAVEEIARRGIELPFGIDVLAFGDEEGVRFPTTLLSSLAVSGVLDQGNLDASDQKGITVRQALRDFHGGDPDLTDLAYRPEDVVGYLEAHIEQGPVLQYEDLPVGIVTSLAGAFRYRISVTGEAGHAGTVPMDMRRDAFAAAAELALAIERIIGAYREHDAVATVGEIALEPGAVNVIPGGVVMSLDIRAAANEPRDRAQAEIEAEADAIALRRKVKFTFEKIHEVSTTPCAKAFDTALSAAIGQQGLRVRRLASGAGHDGQAVAALTGIGMIFVRCRDGISHNPLEFVTEQDMDSCVEVMIAAISELAGAESN